ncbi:MAG TPA: hypothetical protein VJH25_02465 [Candidatus Paceibacterota bacterium]
MSKYPGAVLRKNGKFEMFKATSPKTALRVVRGLLGLRRLTPRDLEKADAVVVYFGDQEKPRIIFPFRYQRSREERKARRYEKRNNCPTIDRGKRNDIGRRQHDVRWPIMA